MQSRNWVNWHKNKYLDVKIYINDSYYIGTARSMWTRRWEYSYSMLNVVAAMLILNLWCEVRNCQVDVSAELLLFHLYLVIL